MNRSGLWIVALCAGAALDGVLVADRAWATPPTPDLNNWMGPCFNCYNYACNRKSAWFAQPGGGVRFPVTCNDVTMKAVADGLTAVAWAPGQAVPAVPAGKCLVALAVDPTAGWVIERDRAGRVINIYPKSDYHWYRLNGDGTWSDKPGGTKAKVFQNGMPPMNVTDPSTANRGRYTSFCGYFLVMPAMPPNLKGGGPWENTGGDALVTRVTNSGPEKSRLAVPPSEMLPFMPSGSPLVSPPILPDPSQGFAGYDILLESGASLGMPGRYFRVAAGVVAVYDRLPDPNIQITYFTDNHGLGTFLRSLFDLPGACCISLGSCAMIGQAACLEQNGTFLGQGSTCGPVSCLSTGGACCLPGGVCTISSPTGCTTGTFLGTLTTCSDPSMCQFVMFGACCLPTECIQTSLGACTALEGGFVGEGLVCTVDTCGLPSGACCFGDNSCEIRNQGACTQLGGQFFADAACAASPCAPAPGACCTGSTCFLTIATICTGPQARFAGPGTVCNLPGNNVFPCCKADFNQSGTVSVQDIFDFLAAYFGGDPRADINGSGSLSVQDIFDFLAAYFAGC